MEFLCAVRRPLPSIGHHLSPAKVVGLVVGRARVEIGMVARLRAISHTLAHPNVRQSTFGDSLRGFPANRNGYGPNWHSKCTICGSYQCRTVQADRERGVSP